MKLQSFALPLAGIATKYRYYERMIFKLFKLFKLTVSLCITTLLLLQINNIFSTQNVNVPINQNKFKYSWQNVGTKIPNNQDGKISLVIAHNNIPYIYYSTINKNYSASEHEVIVMKYISGKWIKLGNTELSSHLERKPLVIDSNGTPYILGYHNKKAIIKKYSGAKWITIGEFTSTYQTDSDPLSEGASIIIDSKDIIYTAFPNNVYISGSKTKIIKYYGDKWTAVGENSFPFSSIYKYSDPNIYISLDGKDVLYAMFDNTVRKYNGTKWELIGNKNCTFNGSLGCNAMEVNKDGIPYIGYVDDSHHISDESFSGITLMKYINNFWNVVGNTCIVKGGMSDLIIDSKGTPYIVYHYIDLTTGIRTMLIKFNGSKWESLCSTSDFSKYPNDWGSVALDNNGLPYIAFYEYNHSNNCIIVKKLTP